MRASAGLIAAAILTFASLGHAQVAPAPPAKDFRLVWLVRLDDRTGAPLGALVFPEHMTLAACARRAARDFATAYTPYERSVGEYIADALHVESIDESPVCLTDAETDVLVRSIKVQTDTVGEVA